MEHIRNFREIFFIPKKYGMFLTRQAQAAENGGNRIWWRSTRYFVATRISIGPLTNKEDIFNQFMEKRDRIFEVKTLTFKTEVTMDIGFQRIITCSKTEFEQKFRNSAFRNYSSKHILWITLSVVRDESLRNMYINKLKVELCLSIASMHIYHCLTSAFK